MSNFSGSIQLRGKAAQASSRAAAGSVSNQKPGGSISPQMARAVASIADFIGTIGLRTGRGVAHTLALFGRPANMSVACGGTTVRAIIGTIHAAPPLVRARRITTFGDLRITTDGDYRGVVYGG